MNRTFVVLGLILVGTLAFAALGRAPRPERQSPLSTTSPPVVPVDKEAISPEWLDTDREGLRFETDGALLETTGIFVFQGGKRIPLDRGRVDRSLSSVLLIDRGAVREEYRFEKKRVEQLFHLEEAVGEGALVIGTRIRTNLAGPVLAESPGAGGWKDPRMRKGGLWFCDDAGEKRIAWYGAMAIDAAGRTVDIEPTYDAGSVLLEVPAFFMANASYPLLVDPWIESADSGLAGGLSDTAAQASINPFLALNNSGDPVVAWQENETSGDVQIYLRVFDGSSWVALGTSASTGGLSNTTGTSGTPSVMVDSANRPVVTWVDSTSGNTEIFVRRWSGTAWDELAGSGSGGGISNGLAFAGDPVVAQNGAGEPVVAWTQNNSIFLRQFTGTTWAELGGSGSGGGVSNNSGTSRNLSLAIDPSGNPVVAWEDNTNGDFEIFLRRWNGSGWIELASSATGGGVSNTATDSLSVSLALDPSGNPVVAWDELNGGIREIHLRVYNGVAWVEIAGSATTGGISNTGAQSTDPSMKVDASGFPLVAWQEATGAGGDEIFLRRFDGTSWIELTGSATAATGGLSNSPGTPSTEAALAFSPDGNPVVAWEAPRPAFQTEIFLRRWTQNGPTSLAQFRSDGVTFIQPGQITDETSITLRGFLSSDITGKATRMQVEVQPTGTGFSGSLTAEGSFTSGESGVLVAGLAVGSKHWRARSVDELGHSSSWIYFGSSSSSEVDFAILELSATNSSGGSSGGGCGLIGLEPLLFLALLYLLRRRTIRASVIPIKSVVPK